MTEAESPREPPPEPATSAAALAEHRSRVAKRLSGGAAAVLILEALAVLFIPRAIAQDEVGLTAGRLISLIALAVLLVVVAGLQRRPWGPQAGLVVQLPVLATGFYTGAMWVLGAVFALTWAYYLRIRADILASMTRSS